MVEWFKAAVLKTAEAKASGSSNLPLSAIFILKFLEKVPFGAIFNGIPARIPIFRLYPGINGRRMKIWLSGK